VAAGRNGHGLETARASGPVEGMVIRRILAERQRKAWTGR
jgi:hypothetical protein